MTNWHITRPLRIMLTTHSFGSHGWLVWLPYKIITKFPSKNVGWFEEVVVYFNTHCVKNFSQVKLLWDKEKEKHSLLPPHTFSSLHLALRCIVVVCGNWSFASSHNTRHNRTTMFWLTNGCNKRMCSTRQSEEEQFYSFLKQWLLLSSPVHVLSHIEQL